MSDIVVKIMAKVLAVLAIATKQTGTAQEFYKNVTERE
jgi:hypothetical protein